MDKKPLVRRFLGFYKPHLALFSADMFCALLIAAIDVAYPLFSKIALQTYLPAGNYNVFFLIVFISAAAFAMRAGLQYVVTALGHRVGVRMEADMRRDVFTHLQKLSFSYFDKSRTGVLMSRCTHDLFEITELAHHGPEDLFISVITFLGAFVVMLTIEWRLALVLFVTVPLMVFVVLMLRKRMLSASRAVKDGMASVNADIESSISGMRVSQAFTNEDYEISKFQRGNDKYVSYRSGYFKVMGVFFAVMEFFTDILKVIVLGIGGYMIMQGNMDVVALMTFTLYVSSFTTPIRKLTTLSETFTMGITGFKRFCELMDTQPEIEDVPHAHDLCNVNGNVTFENVTFTYDEGVKVLSHINIDVKAGMTVALVGPSGGGKTTLTQLIPRFYEPVSGRVLIDGQNVRDMTLHSLREHIGIVQQDVFMFADTIRENIRYGRRDASEAEIIEAAKAAEIHADIMAMPNGYDTLVGERGTTLSGGQKQRISIARIFLKNPPILILDEATSALDSVTEIHISAALEKLSSGRTTFIIAHRLSTVKNADSIIVIDHGRILEKGTHDELMAAGKEYARLYSAQMR